MNVNQNVTAPMELSRRISIAPIESEKINNPVYAAYSEMVRSRIKEKVYQNYDKIERGSVYLTFLLDNRGVLVVAKIIPEKTDASSHLQEISLRSLREASPFSRFFKGHDPSRIYVQYRDRVSSQRIGPETCWVDWASYYSKVDFFKIR